MKKYIFIFVLFLFGCNLYSEVREYKNNDKGYNINIEIQNLGENLGKKNIDDYSAQLFTWCESLGKDVKTLKTLPEELEWGIYQNLSEITVQKNATYIARVLYDINIENNSFTQGIVIFTIKSDNPQKIKPEKIITVRILGDQLETSETFEISQNEFENKKLGYKGSSTASFVGIDLSSEEIKEISKVIYNTFGNQEYQIRNINKFTKEQEWLLFQALNKYALKKNETYLVSLIVSPKSFPTSFSPITAIVTITEIRNMNDFSYNFIAYESTQLKTESTQDNNNVIESRIDGEFSGWEGDTIFKLQNGQIWQQVEYSYTYTYKYCPEVIILKTSEGWKLKVDGIDKTIRVQRIK